MKRRIMLVLFVAVCTVALNCSRDKNPTNPSIPTTSDSAIARQTHDLINNYRASQGLSALSYNNTIADVALQHSRNMAAGAVAFSHDGFNDRMSTIANSLKMTSGAENVAYNQGYENPAAVAVEGWIQSPGHHSNIVGDFNVTGIGVAVNDKNEFYFTQIFVKSY